MMPPRTEKLDLRITAPDKRLIQAGANAAHQTVSAFVLTSALQRAAEILPDRLHFGLDATHWEAWQAALDAPPRPLERIGALLRLRSLPPKDAA